MFICRLVSLLSLLTLSLAHEAATLHFLSPHPLAGIPVDSESATTMLQHYGKPPAECEEDEKAFQISGVPGMVRVFVVVVVFVLLVVILGVVVSRFVPKSVSHR